MAGVENTTYLNGLNALNPEAQDFISQGDDHIRLLKGVLLATFPGFNRPIDGALFKWANDPLAVSVYQKFIETDGRVGALEAFTSPAHPDGAILRANNNLSDVADPAAARANLGVPELTDTLLSAKNLSDLTNVALARANLNVPSTSEALLVSNNLSDLSNVLAARTALGVSPTTDVVLKANNLSDVDAPTARANLAVPAAADVLVKANNLSDLTNVIAARSALQVLSESEVTSLIASAISGVSGISDVPLDDVYYVRRNQGWVDGATAFQALLVSGTNIKTVNGASLLGSGNLTAGLNNFTEARDTVFPNNTVPLHSVAATGAEANIGVGVFPKGTGAFQLRVGGSKRGDYAVDLQISAAGGGMAATGPYSAIGGGSSNQAQNNYSAVFAGLSNNVSTTYGTIVGGQSNTVSGSYGFVGGGYNNQAQTFNYITIGGGASNAASNGYSTIGGGNTNTASGTTSTIAGGQSNTASGQDSFIGGGFTNAASGLRSVVAGGSNNTASGNRAAVLAGQQNTCSGESSSVIAGNWAVSRSNTGTAIVGMYSGQAAIKTMSKQTTDATPARMDDDWASNAVYFMADSSNVSASIQVVGRDGTDDYAAWIEVLLRRASGAGTVAIVGAQVRREIKSGGAAAWAADVVADTTNGGLGLQVTGAAAKTIKWFATLVVNERRNA